MFYRIFPERGKLIWSPEKISRSLSVQILNIHTLSKSKSPHPQKTKTKNPNGALQKEFQNQKSLQPIAELNLTIITTKKLNPCYNTHYSLRPLHSSSLGYHVYSLHNFLLSWVCLDICRILFMFFFLFFFFYGLKKNAVHSNSQTTTPPLPYVLPGFIQFDYYAGRHNLWPTSQSVKHRLPIRFRQVSASIPIHTFLFCPSFLFYDTRASMIAPPYPVCLVTLALYGFHSFGLTTTSNDHPLKRPCTSPLHAWQKEACT